VSSQRSPNPLAGGNGASCPFLKNPTPVTALWVPDDRTSLTHQLFFGNAHTAAIQNVASTSIPLNCIISIGLTVFALLTGVPDSQVQTSHDATSVAMASIPIFSACDAG